MAAGDGFADIIGRRFGTNNKWFFNESKSIAGSVAFFFASSLCALALVSWLAYAGSLSLSFGTFPLLQRILIISALCAGVELLPFGDDNWNVPISAALLATILLRWSLHYTWNDKTMNHYKERYLLVRTIHPSIHPFVSPYIHLSIHQSVRTYIHQSISQSINQSMNNWGDDLLLCVYFFAPKWSKSCYQIIITCYKPCISFHSVDRMLFLYANTYTHYFMMIFHAKTYNQKRNNLLEWIEDICSSLWKW